METPVFVSAVRSPIGRFRGSLKDVHVGELASAVARAALERAHVDAAAVDELVMSDTYRADLPGCSGRPVGLRAGLPIDVPSVNLNMHCGSGLKAIVQAGQSIRCGDTQVVLVVALESMSRAAFLLRGARNGFPLGHTVLVDQLVQKGDPARDRALDPTGGWSNGETAENLAERHGIGRERQDRYAVRSHQRAVAAWAAGRFDTQIVPIPIPAGKGGTQLFSRDEHPRADSTYEALARLKPVFKAGGTVTAGNSSGMNDGAAALVMMSESHARAIGAPILGRLRGHASAGVPPEIMGIGPVPATRKMLRRIDVKMEDFAVIEVNEAFAAQTLACFDEYPELGAREEMVNAHGSGISLGHPIGATGAILAVKALHELQRLGGGLGLLTMCIGGGQGIAVAVQA